MNRRLCIRLLVILLVIDYSSVWAQDTCQLQLTGIVRDADTNEPMAFVNIFLEEAAVGAVTDEKGRYQIADLCAGSYTVVCSHVGCDHVSEQVVIGGTSTKDFLLEHVATHLESLEIKAKRQSLEQTAASETLDGAALDTRKGLGLGAALEALPGVQTLQTGASISKPVIQGLHSNRILVLNNGIRQEGQQWGVEHAPEIDPYVADKLTVIKGAGAIRYGADAIGGVVLVEPRSLPKQKGMEAGLMLGGQSNGRIGTVSAFAEGRLSDRIPLSGRIQGTLKKGGNQKTPDYFLANTGQEEYNFSYALGYQKRQFSTELYYSQFNTNLAIFSGSHIGNLTDLKNAFEAERPLVEADFTYELRRPFQHIEHELFKSKSWLKTGTKGKLEIQYGRQYNLRQEFDAHDGPNEDPNDLSNPEIQFRTTTHSADVVWSHLPIRQLRGSLGLQYLNSRSKVNKGALIPGSQNQRIGVFWQERWRQLGVPLEIEAGVRYDWQLLDVVASSNSPDTSLNYGGLSSTLGAIYRFPKDWQVKALVALAWRAPSVNELFSDGIHHGAASYERGRADLVREQALKTQLAVKYDGEHLNVNVSAYYNRIKDFLFLQAEAEPILTIRGAFPAYSFQQADARIAGVDAQIDYSWTDQWQWSNQVSILRAYNKTIDDHLVLMPADQVKSSLRYYIKKEEQQRAYVGVSGRHVFEQSRIPAQGDFVAAPKAYTLVGLEAGWPIRIGQQQMDVNLQVSNLFNVAYRDYLNRFRYFADEVGRSIFCTIKIPILN